jgi:hypothetical protein
MYLQFIGDINSLFSRIFTWDASYERSSPKPHLLFLITGKKVFSYKMINQEVLSQNGFHVFPAEGQPECPSQSCALSTAE